MRPRALVLAAGLVLSFAGVAQAQAPSAGCAGLGLAADARAFFTEHGFPDGSVMTGPGGETMWSAGLPDDGIRPAFMQAVVIGDEAATSVAFLALLASHNPPDSGHPWSLDELDLALDTWFDLIDTFAFADFPPDARGRPERSSVVQPEVTHGTIGDREFNRAMTIDAEGIHLSADVTAIPSDDPAGCAALEPVGSPSAAP